MSVRVTNNWALKKCISNIFYSKGCTSRMKAIFPHTFIYSTCTALPLHLSMHCLSIPHISPSPIVSERLCKKPKQTFQNYFGIYQTKKCVHLQFSFSTTVLYCSNSFTIVKNIWCLCLLWRDMNWTSTSQYILQKRLTNVIIAI